MGLVLSVDSDCHALSGIDGGSLNGEGHATHYLRGSAFDPGTGHACRHSHLMEHHRVADSGETVGDRVCVTLYELPVLLIVGSGETDAVAGLNGRLAYLTVEVVGDVLSLIAVVVAYDGGYELLDTPLAVGQYDAVELSGVISAGHLDGVGTHYKVLAYGNIYD